MGSANVENVGPGNFAELFRRQNGDTLVFDLPRDVVCYVQTVVKQNCGCSENVLESADKN